ncbi:MAG: 1-deoxy-D-xylulose-5-phosphate reductoisomerase [Candidatus Omnitrophota bacterium]|nr:1-deoxy-D-xylulose-5-phosphate reductoisomerase [Candidatus Omnitrophota bacterium]MBU2528091.1 1-deoxy-D-xylulose-5-phosphate reductoisomerase [bacterium]MBU3929707.1 1-deoxy-D-xylulose-5-phosphate reductoisomerase [bacterium]MBU4123688.1 1-deoxy-D-xylulose-5-phosphate reductoisomerase [bacterium]
MKKTPPKNICLLGSTGSIGRQVLEVAGRSRNFRIVSMSAHSNTKLFAEQMRKFKPEKACITDQASFEKYPRPLAGAAKILPPDKLSSLCTDKKTDLVIAGSSGSSALIPILEALSKGKTVALANKEPIVMAGDILTAAAKKHGGKIIPVDSEHSAIFQCMENSKVTPEKIYITASGGAILTASGKKITPGFILAHPIWKMGKKITVDSSTGMNKGLEVIEAHHLFSMDFSRIAVLLHPKALIHGMIEFADGSVNAYLSMPDMKIPISYALHYPQKQKMRNLMNFTKLDMTLEKYPAGKFICFGLALDAGKKGGLYPAALVGANETAVKAFLDERIPFARIAPIIRKTLSETPKMRYNIPNVLRVEKWAKGRAEKLIK